MSQSHTGMKRFRVSRTFVTFIEAPGPYAAIEMVRANSEAYDTDIIERAELVSDEMRGES